MAGRPWSRDSFFVLIAVGVLMAIAATSIAMVLDQYAKVHEVDTQFLQSAEAELAEAAARAAQHCGHADQISLRDCIAQELQGYAASQSTNQDLRAQQDMAFWALWMVIVSGVGILLTAAGVFLIWRTLGFTKEATLAALATVVEAEKATSATIKAADAAVEANKLQREIFITEQRASLVLIKAEISSDLVWDKKSKSGQISAVIRMKNSGRTNARKVHGSVEIVNRANINTRDRLDDMIKRLTSFADLVGMTAFPNQTIGFPEVITIESSQITPRGHGTGTLDAQIADPWEGPTALFLQLNVCIVYQTAFDDRWHQLGIVFDLHRRPGAEGEIAIGPFWGDVPKRDLELRRHGLGDIGAY